MIENHKFKIEKRQFAIKQLEKELQNLQNIKEEKKKKYPMQHPGNSTFENLLGDLRIH